MRYFLSKIWEYGCLHLLLGFIFCGSTMVLAEERDASWGTVQEPEFGEVLYHFYQANYYSALTQLKALKHASKLSHHTDHAELLLGGIYLSYGMDEAAGDIFATMLAKRARPEVRDRAWYYLGKFRYQRGYYAEAKAAFVNIRENLPVDLREESLVLLATIEMNSGQYNQAIKTLDRLKGKSSWTNYGFYNLGVALIKKGQREKGIDILRRLGKMRVREDEMLALRDKANLAIGYTYLQADKPAKAMGYLEKVSLEGMLSNKALLGMGWAYSAQDKQDRALVYWTELQKRNVMDAAVQESLLAVPYAYGKLRAYNKAVTQYQQASELYQAEIDRLDGAIRAIRSGELTRQLVKLDIDSEKGWFWSPRNLPDAPASHYLSHLLTSHRFQEALKNYRDLRFLQNDLDQRTTTLDSFDSLLATRKRVYYNRMPALKRKHRVLNIELAQKQRERLAESVAANRASRNSLELATDKEKEQLAALRRIEDKLRRKGKRQDVSEYQDRYRRLKGMLVWNIARDYPVRRWEVKKNIGQLDAALAQAKNSTRMFHRLQQQMPDILAKQNQRVNRLRARLVSVQSKTRSLERALDRYLQAIAIDSLKQQQQRLKKYLIQAQFNQAQLLDQALQSREKR